MESDPASDRFHRLHPISLPLRFLGQAKVLLVPGLLVLFLAREGRWEVWLMLAFVPWSIYEILRYMTLRYRFGEDEIVVQEGLVFRNERHIPFVRIQNIDLVQQPLERLFGVAEVRLETAGGSESEGVFRVLSLASVEAMRSRVFAERGLEGNEGPVPAAPEERTVLRLSTGDLVRLGLISNRGVAVVLIALGAAWEFDVFETVDWSGGFGDLVDEIDPRFLWLVFLGGLIGSLGLLMMFSVVWTIIRFHDFRLERRDDDLRLACGLLTRRSATVPLHRIQLVSVRETLFHRMFGRASVSVETAGGAGEGDGNDQTVFSRKWFAPLVPRSEVASLLGRLRPEVDWNADEWESLAPKAWIRMTRKLAVVALLAAALLAVIVDPWAATSVVVFLPLAVGYARASVRRMGYRPTPQGIFFRSGVWTRRTRTTFFDKIQVVSLEQSPFDRRWGMASLRIATAGAGPANHRIHIPYLEKDTARTLLESLFLRAEHSEFRW